MQAPKSTRIIPACERLCQDSALLAGFGPSASARHKSIDDGGRMKSVNNLPGILGLVAALSLPLAAQWPPYPTRDVPRTADGKPELTAPAPRTADGKPDLSGIWNYAGVLGFRGGPPDPPPGHAARRRRSGTSKPGSRMACPSSRGQPSCASSAWRPTARTTPTPRACRSGTCSCTRTRSRARSSRPRT